MPNTADTSPDIASMIERFVAFKPQYQEIMKYLTAAGRVPSQRSGDAGRDSNGNKNDAVYKVLDNSITYDPAVAADINKFPSTAVHELTHAAQQAMQQQQFMQFGTPFADAYKKLMAPTTAMTVKTANPDQAAYRNNPRELQAFGQGAVSSPAYVEPIFGAQPHIDMTRAQEFEILLDLAMRDMNAKGKK